MKDTTQALLHIENLKTVISSKDGKLVPVDGVDITIPKGKTVGIVGESGCGKSMTAMSVMGLLPNTTHIEEGKILFQDMDLTKLNPKELRKITGDKISIIFQEPMTSLNPVIQVGKQVLKGEWRAPAPPVCRYEIVERNHRMDQASWGGYVRHNELYRRIYDLEGGLLEEEFLFANDAIMMYSPLLPEES